MSEIRAGRKETTVYMLSVSLPLDERNVATSEELARHVSAILPSPPVVARRIRVLNPSEQRFRQVWLLIENNVNKSFLESLRQMPASALEVSVK